MATVEQEEEEINLKREVKCRGAIYNSFKECILNRKREYLQLQQS